MSVRTVLGWNRNDLQRVADYLRKTVETQDGVSIERRADVFEGKSALLAMVKLSTGGSKFATSLPQIPNVETARLILKRLLAEGFFIRAIVKGSKAVPLTSFQATVAQAERAANPDAPQPVEQRILVVEPDPVVTWSEDAKYIWLYEGSLLWTYVMACAVVVMILGGVMFPLWPYRMKAGAWYVSMMLLILLGVFVVLLIVRFIVFLLSLPFCHGFWLFPNLCAEVGIIESFIPLYEFEGSAGPKKAKSV